MAVISLSRRELARLHVLIDLAEGRISILLVAVISPLILPATMIEAALICAVTTAVSPTVRLSFPTISPSIWPSILVGPSKLSLPLIFEPLSR